jgi:hypothetical protein
MPRDEFSVADSDSDFAFHNVRDLILARVSVRPYKPSRVDGMLDNGEHSGSVFRQNFVDYAQPSERQRPAFFRQTNGMSLARHDEMASKFSTIRLLRKRTSHGAVDLGVIRNIKI